MFHSCISHGLTPIFRTITYRGDSETVLKQGAEIKGSGTLGYTNDAAHAVKQNGTLILKGIEKTEWRIVAFHIPTPWAVEKGL